MLFEENDIEFGDRIGGGAIGIVCHGIITENEQRVALKFMVCQTFLIYYYFQFNSDSSRSEMLDELRTMSSLSNPHIVSLLGGCTTSARPFLVMQLCEASLFHILHEQRILSDLTFTKRLSIIVFQSFPRNYMLESHYNWFGLLAFKAPTSHGS